MDIDAVVSLPVGEITANRDVVSINGDLLGTAVEKSERGVVLQRPNGMRFLIAAEDARYVELITRLS